VEGTDEPEPCPAGTFSNALGKPDQVVKPPLICDCYYYIIK